MRALLPMLALVCAAVAPIAAQAQEPPTPAVAAQAQEPPTLSAGVATMVILNRSYAAGGSAPWADGATAFWVSDANSDRAGWPELRILVFPDTAAAAAFRQAWPEGMTAQAEADSDR